MEDGADGAGGDEAGGTRRGVEFGAGESLGSSGAGGSGAGKIPPVVYLFIAAVFLVVWGVLSLF